VHNFEVKSASKSRALNEVAHEALEFERNSRDFLSNSSACLKMRDHSPRSEIGDYPHSTTWGGGGLSTLVMGGFGEKCGVVVARVRLTTY